jgi:hypothetical protein
VQKVAVASLVKEIQLFAQHKEMQKVGVASLVQGTQLFAQQHGRAKSWRGEFSNGNSIICTTTRACEKLPWQV